jgi:hypothetical protein
MACLRYHLSVGRAAEADAIAVLYRGRIDEDAVAEAFDARPAARRAPVPARTAWAMRYGAKRWRL